MSKIQERQKLSEQPGGSLEGKEAFSARWESNQRKFNRMNTRAKTSLGEAIKIKHEDESKGGRISLERWDEDSATDMGRKHRISLDCAHGVGLTDKPTRIQGEIGDILLKYAPEEKKIEGDRPRSNSENLSDYRYDRPKDRGIILDPEETKTLDNLKSTLHAYLNTEASPLSFDLVVTQSTEYFFQEFITQWRDFIQDKITPELPQRQVRILLPVPATGLYQNDWLSGSPVEFLYLDTSVNKGKLTVPMLEEALAHLKALNTLPDIVLLCSPNNCNSVCYTNDEIEAFTTVIKRFCSPDSRDKSKKEGMVSAREFKGGSDKGMVKPSHEIFFFLDLALRYRPIPEAGDLFAVKEDFSGASFYSFAKLGLGKLQLSVVAIKVREEFLALFDTTQEQFVSELQERLTRRILPAGAVPDKQHMLTANEVLDLRYKYLMVEHVKQHIATNIAQLEKLRRHVRKVNKRLAKEEEKEETTIKGEGVEKQGGPISKIARKRGDKPKHVVEVCDPVSKTYAMNIGVIRLNDFFLGALPSPASASNVLHNMLFRRGIHVVTGMHFFDENMIIRVPLRVGDEEMKGLFTVLCPFLLECIKGKEGYVRSLESRYRSPSPSSSPSHSPVLKPVTPLAVVPPVRAAASFCPTQGPKNDEQERGHHSKAGSGDREEGVSQAKTGAVQADAHQDPKNNEWKQGHHPRTGSRDGSICRKSSGGRDGHRVRIYRPVPDQSPGRGGVMVGVGQGNFLLR